MYSFYFSFIVVISDVFIVIMFHFHNSFNLYEKQLKAPGEFQ